jgi:Protein of unknown function with PCYCGC motif
MTYRRLLFSALAFSLVSGLALTADTNLIAATKAAESDAAKTSGQAAGKDAAATGTQKGAGSDKTDSAYSGPPVLDPTRFFGGAAMGYASAKAAPQIMSKLFCYCGCDGTEKHQHLIDCFTSDHGTDCHICQEEAVSALKMYRDKTPVAEIQRQIDEEFHHHYPFEEETANYKNYKASRLWTGAATGTANTSETAGPEPACKDNKNAAGDAKGKDGGKSAKTATGPKVKPGYHVGNCCGGDTK